MNVLLIGGTGCMGKSLTKYLLEDGHEVTLLNRGNVKSEFANHVKHIVCDRKDTDLLFEKTHAAGPYHCVIDMLSFTRQDAQNAVKVFGGRCEQYIYCSTVDVFQKDQLQYPINEDSFRNASESFQYAYEKLASEGIYEEYSRKDSFKLTVVRPAATYTEGSGMPIADIGSPLLALDRLMKGKPIILHGDGSSIWVETYADDVSRAIANAALNKKAYNRSYNIMGDEYLSWRSYWRILAKAAGAPEPSFAFIPTHVLKAAAPAAAMWCYENFTYNNLFDNTRAKTELGFRQTVKFEEGAKRCLDCLLKNNSEEIENGDWYDNIIALWEYSCDNFIQAARNYQS